MIRHALLVVGLVAAGVACSNADRETPIRQTLDAARVALAAGDVVGFMELWTDDGLEAVFHEAGDAFVTNTGYYIGAKQFSLGSAVTTSSTTAVAALFFRYVGVVREFTFVQQGDEWLIDGATVTTTSDVESATPVNVTFGDDVIEFDASLIVDGNIVLQVQNPTARRHELHILTAPPDQDIAQFFEHPELGPPVPEGKSMPEGFDFVGGVSALEPGENVTIVFSQVLPAARYVMFCNNEDTPGEPHSKRGEFAEFTIT